MSQIMKAYFFVLFWGTICTFFLDFLYFFGAPSPWQHCTIRTALYQFRSTSLKESVVHDLRIEFIRLYGEHPLKYMGIISYKVQSILSKLVTHVMY